jgi:F420-non-reducing hydrogenase iron-sulfur subunit
VGIEGERLNLVWVSSAEGPRFAEEITRFTEKIKDLGPLNWSSKPAVQTSPLMEAAASK